MSEVTLLRPDVKLKDSYIAGMRALQAEGYPWLQDLDLNSIDKNFDFYVAKLLQAAFIRTSALVPETLLWGVVDGQFAGKIGIRHELNESLRLEGGNIGYEVVPSYRQQGIASEMLRQALPIARELGLQRVLITCNDSNHGSSKVIEKNGGVLEKKATLSSGVLKRYYWISL